MNKVFKHFKKNMMLLAPVFALVLSFFFKSFSFASEPFSFRINTYNLPPVYVSNGYEYTYTVSNPGMFDVAVASGYGRFLLYCSPALSYPIGNYSVTLDNVRLMYAGQIFYASYISSGTGGLYVFDFSTTITDNQHCSLLADIHFWGSNGTITVSGVVLNWNIGVQSYSNITNPSSIQQVSDSAVLAESKKQTSALTDFSRKDEMSSNASTNGSIMGDYTKSEDAVVSDAHSGLSKFDFLAPLKFAAGLSQSVLLCSTWLSDLIAAMGDFSYIFTLGSALTIVICIFVGLSRFKRGG